MASKSIFGSVKSKADAARKTAASKLRKMGEAAASGMEKFGTALDEKLEKAQGDLERKREELKANKDQSVASANPSEPSTDSQDVSQELESEKLTTIPAAAAEITTTTIIPAATAETTTTTTTPTATVETTTTSIPILTTDKSLETETNNTATVSNPQPNVVPRRVRSKRGSSIKTNKTETLEVTIAKTVMHGSVSSLDTDTIPDGESRSLTTSSPHSISSTNIQPTDPKPGTNVESLIGDSRSVSNPEKSIIEERTTPSSEQILLVPEYSKLQQNENRMVEASNSITSNCSIDEIPESDILRDAKLDPCVSTTDNQNMVESTTINISDSLNENRSIKGDASVLETEILSSELISMDTKSQSEPVEFEMPKNSPNNRIDDFSRTLYETMTLDPNIKTNPDIDAPRADDDVEKTVEKAETKSEQSKIQVQPYALDASNVQETDEAAIETTTTANTTDLADRTKEIQETNKTDTSHLIDSREESPVCVSENDQLQTPIQTEPVGVSFKHSEIIIDNPSAIGRDMDTDSDVSNDYIIKTIAENELKPPNTDNLHVENDVSSDQNSDSEKPWIKTEDENELSDKSTMEEPKTSDFEFITDQDISRNITGIHDDSTRIASEYSSMVDDETKTSDKVIDDDTIYVENELQYDKETSESDHESIDDVNSLDSEKDTFTTEEPTDIATEMANHDMLLAEQNSTRPNTIIADFSTDSQSKNFVLENDNSHNAEVSEVSHSIGIESKSTINDSSGIQCETLPSKVTVHEMEDDKNSEELVEQNFSNNKTATSNRESSESDDDTSEYFMKIPKIDPARLNDTTLLLEKEQRIKSLLQKFNTHVDSYIAEKGSDNPDLRVERAHRISRVTTLDESETHNQFIHERNSHENEDKPSEFFDEHTLDKTESNLIDTSDEVALNFIKKTSLQAEMSEKQNERTLTKISSTASSSPELLTNDDFNSDKEMLENASSSNPKIIKRQDNVDIIESTASPSRLDESTDEIAESDSDDDIFALKPKTEPKDLSKNKNGEELAKASASNVKTSSEDQQSSNQANSERNQVTETRELTTSNDLHIKSSFESQPVDVTISIESEKTNILRQISENTETLKKNSSRQLSQTESLDFDEQHPATQTSAIHTTSLEISKTSSNNHVPNRSRSMLSSSFRTTPQLDDLHTARIHQHSIPTQLTPIHMACSLQYIFICNTDYQVFYTEFNFNNMIAPLEWNPTNHYAEKLAVSSTNKNLWRWYNKQLSRSSDVASILPLGSKWAAIPIGHKRSVLGFSVNDECGWILTDDGNVLLIHASDNHRTLKHVICVSRLINLYGLSEKIAVIDEEGYIMVREGCTDETPEGLGWKFIEATAKKINDITTLPKLNGIAALNKNDRLMILDFENNKQNFFQVRCGDESTLPQKAAHISSNGRCLLYSDGQERLFILSGSVIGFRWDSVMKRTNFQRLTGAFCDQSYFVWALNADKAICSSEGLQVDKPIQAQFITQATFVPSETFAGTICWALDESCNIYVRDSLHSNGQWNTLDQMQFELSRRLVHVACNEVGVWAIDDYGSVHFRHGHGCHTNIVNTLDFSLMSAAWINIPSRFNRARSFDRIFCGPADWMVYATDNKQTVYYRFGISEENPLGTTWKQVEDCSALELAISMNNVWALTSTGRIQCYENISRDRPMGTNSRFLPGTFLSIAVSIDDQQVWGLSKARELLKLNRLTILFEN